MQVDRREKYQQMRTLLNEKQWRQYLALEAKERGSVSLVAQEAAVSANTVRRGVREVEAGAGYTPGDRQREKGGGRKKASEKDATVLADVEGLLEPKGDRTRLLKWTSKSVAHLKAALQARGHTIADTALRDVLLALGYRLAANKKTMEGTSHEDRDGQFAHMKERCAQFERAGHPIMSVDCKKKELLITADGAGPTGSEIGSGSRNCRRSPLRKTSRSPWPIIRLRPCRWNKIEHRLCAFISIKWRAKPLTSLEVVLELISHTTTTEGLTVTAVKDSQTYPTGLKVTDEEVARLHLLKDAFHGEWTYTIKPQEG